MAKAGPTCGSGLRSSRPPERSARVTTTRTPSIARFPPFGRRSERSARGSSSDEPVVRRSARRALIRRADHRVAELAAGDDRRVGRAARESSERHRADVPGSRDVDAPRSFSPVNSRLPRGRGRRAGGRHRRRPVGRLERWNGHPCFNCSPSRPVRRRRAATVRSSGRAGRRSPTRRRAGSSRGRCCHSSSPSRPRPPGGPCARGSRR